MPSSTASIRAAGRSAIAETTGIPQVVEVIPPGVGEPPAAARGGGFGILDEDTRLARDDADRECVESSWGGSRFR